MRWFKCLNPQSPAMLSAEKAVGKHGAWEIIKAVCEALDMGVQELDVDMVSNWASVKMDRAERLLPFAQKILLETLKISRKSSANVQESTGNPRKSSDNLKESSKNLSDFTPSSPVPDRIPIEREELTSVSSIEEKENTPGARVFSDEVEKCALYLEGLELPNLMNFNGLRSRLAMALDKAGEKFPDLKPAQLVECWFSACDVGASQAASSLEFFFTVFERKAAQFKPGTQSVRTAAKGPSFDEKIFNAWKDGKALRWSISNESFPPEDLTPCNTINSALSTLNGFTMPDGTRATYREFVIANE